MLQSLIDEHHKTASSLCEKDLAILERKIWIEVKKSRKYNRYIDWINNSGLGSVHKCQSRMTLINSGDCAEPLWDRIANDKMPAFTAVKLLRKARVIVAETGKSEAEAIREVLDEYDNDDNMTTATIGGRTFRRKKPKIKKTKFSDDTGNVKKLWVSLDAIMTGFLQTRLEGLDESICEDITADFIFQIRAVYEDVMRDVNGHRKDAKQEAIIRIGSYRLRQACESLGVQVPKFGDPVNLQEAKIRYRKLAARFHPDRNNGQDNMVKQYHAVNEALETIKAYMENLDG